MRARLFQWSNGVNRREIFQAGMKGTAEPQLYPLSLLYFKSMIKLLGL